MKRKSLKKILGYTFSALSLLILILCMHIYLVTKPKAPDANTRIMARIDIKHDISKTDADHITAWMYRQNGVDHVLCNPESDILVFTYSPLKTNADKILAGFRTDFHLPAYRIVPAATDRKNGCPVASGSISYKAYSLIKRII